MSRTQSPSTRPPQMYRGLDRNKSAHSLYMKMSYLELERTRRRKELGAMQGRLKLLDDRIAEIDDEIALTQAQIAEHPDGVSADRLDKARDIVRAGDADSSTAEPGKAGKPGFMIKY